LFNKAPSKFEERAGGREGGKEGRSYLQMHRARQEATPFLSLVQIKAPSVVERVLSITFLVDATVQVELREGGREGRKEGGKEGGRMGELSPKE